MFTRALGSVTPCMRRGAPTTTNSASSPTRRRPVYYCYYFFIINHTIGLVANDLRRTWTCPGIVVVVVYALHGTRGYLDSFFFEALIVKSFLNSDPSVKR